MKELELKKPITAHGETLSVLEFDEPTGKDVRELGYPYQMNQDESVRLLAHVVSKYIVRLSASAAICNRAASGKRTVKLPPRRRSSVTWLPAPFVRPQSAKRRMPSHDCLRPQLPR